jgi:hypothetical protein
MAGGVGGTLADPVAVGGSFADAVALEIADANGDAAADAIVFGPDGTHTFLRDDAGSLAGLTCDARSVITTPTGGAETVAVGDLTGDGGADVAGAQRSPVVRLLTQQLAGADVAASVATAATGPTVLGQTVDVTGTLTTPAGRCGAPGQVQLERTLPSGSPQIVATGDLTATSTDGTSASFEFEDVPTEVGSVEYRVLWAGDTVHAAAASDPVSVTVTKRSSSLTLHASDTDILAGASVTLTATLTGGDRPASISFFKVVNGARTPVGTGPVNGSDVASVDVAPLVSTTYVATYAATPTAKGATSGTVTVKVAKKASSLSLSAPTAITFGHAATLTAKLTGGGNGTRKVAFWVFKDGAPVFLGRVAVNGKGRASFVVKPKRNSTYRATYGGNATWSSATSPKRTVKVHVVTTGKMVHYGHRDNGVAFYVCCRAYYAFKVAPNHAGFKVLVSSQYLDGSRWKSFDGSSKTFKLRADSTQEIFIDIDGGKPYRFRVHACLAKHADHLGDCSAWVGYRFE